MLGWFKKKFQKKEETAVPAADLKIPVAPRDFQTGKQPDDAPSVTVTTESTALSELQESAEPIAESTPVPDEKETQPVEVSTESVETSSLISEELLADECEPVPPGQDEIPSDEQVEVTETKPEIEIEQISEVTAQDVIEDTTPIQEPSEVEPAAPEEPTTPEDVPEIVKTPEVVEIVEVPEIAPEEIVSEEIPLKTEVSEKQKPAIKEEDSQKIPVAAVRVPLASEETKPAKESKPLFSRLTEKLSRTRETFTYQLDTLFLGKKNIDNELLDDLEELLITADLGVATTQEILDHARKKVKRNELSNPDALKEVLKAKLKSFITDHHKDAALVMPKEGPFVIMVIGVNGVGKTTTIGKVAHKFVQSGQSVLLVAADTFRAAAVSQLKIWGERNNVAVLSQKEGTDPSSVVFDAIAHAKAKQYDVVLVDTAGRLHTQANLMEELKKIKRVMAKQLPGAPHEVMLVVDATTGQNGISQAKLFDAAVDITGIALTKLDGTAKGGIVANISKELKTPIRFIGIGERLEDLRDFDPDEFIDALFQDTRTDKK
jgi:fused signal recognition particle receptor